MTVNNANGTATTLWLNPGEDFSPKGWLHGATKSELKVFSEEEKPDGIDPAWILSATTQVNSLSPNVWYYAFAIDQAQCLAVQSLVIEKPKPTFAWGWEGNTGANKWLGTNDSTDLRLWTDSTERMVIKADGNIGIGTNDPQAKLEVNGPVKLTSDLIITGAEELDFGINPMLPCPFVLAQLQDGKVASMSAETFTDYCLINYLNSANLNMWKIHGNTIDDNMYIGTNNDKPFKIKTNNTERLRIDASGNVGLGTTNPLQALHVNGISYFNSNVGIGTSNPQQNLQVNGVSYFNGNVGIGTSNPQQALHVSGVSYFYDKMGMGTTSPQARLHIKNSEDWSMFVETSHPADWGYGLVSRVDRDLTKAFVTQLNGDDKVTIYGNGDMDVDGNVDICGQVRSHKIRVESDCWFDDVFNEEYPLETLREKEAFVKMNKHLPGIPSEREITQNGLDIGETVGGQMKHIEEIYLYLFEMKKEMDILKRENAELKEIIKDISTDSK